MSKTIVENWVDWGRAFVDPDGSFYAGTTKEQMEVAARVAEAADLWINTTDVHSRGSTEFSVNGGLYPAHNLVRKDWHDLDQLGVAEGKTVSPELTDRLQRVVAGKPAGLVVPRHVFFQDYDGQDPATFPPCFAFADVQETFGVPPLDPEAFLDGAVPYVINAKHLFNGTGIQDTSFLGRRDGVPDSEANAYTLLKRRFGQGKDLVLNHTGVVMGICVYQTASGGRQLFPKAEVNIIADGATHLLMNALGFADKDTADFALRKMCQQVGVNYIRNNEYLGRW